MEVLGVVSSLQRIDIVADQSPAEPQGPRKEPEGDRWDTIEDALKATKNQPRPDPWDRLTR